jgi:hypothetical protein
MEEEFDPEFINSSFEEDEEEDEIDEKELYGEI